MNSCKKIKLKYSDTFMGKFGCWCTFEVTPYGPWLYTKNSDHQFWPSRKKKKERENLECNRKRGVGVQIWRGYLDQNYLCRTMSGFLVKSQLIKTLR